MALCFLILFVIFMPGCKKVKIEKEFSKIQKRTYEITDSEVVYSCFINKDVAAYESQIIQGLSRNEAIGIALLNNPELQADFENLGIAKADLIQAGLYTNPNINSVFRFPTASQGPGTGQTNIESVIAFRLADLWQVPLTKQVAADILEITTLRILTIILDTVYQTTTAYDDCLKSKEELKNAQALLQEVKEFKDEVYYRQKFGYSSDLDDYKADLQVNYFEIETIHYAVMLKTSYIHLKKVLGLDPTVASINITEDFYFIPHIPSLEELEYYALDTRPEIQISRIKIKQYQDTIRLEKAKFWKEVDIGIAFKQDFDKPFRGWGPYISLDLPIFDNNHAQVARAEFLLKQAQKELLAQTIGVKEEIRKAYEMFDSHIKEVEIYNENILPTHEKAILWAYKYASSMQVNMLVAIQTKIDLYETQKKFIETQYSLLHTFAKLERATGKKLNITSITP